MKTYYRFTTTKKVNGAFFTAGTVVMGGTFDRGTLESLARTGEVVPCEGPRLAHSGEAQPEVTPALAHLGETPAPEAESPQAPPVKSGKKKR